MYTPGPTGRPNEVHNNKNKVQQTIKPIDNGSIVAIKVPMRKLG